MAQQEGGAVIGAHLGQFVEDGLLEHLVIHGFFNGMILIHPHRQVVYLGFVDHNSAHMPRSVFVFAHVVRNSKDPRGKAILRAEPIGSFYDFEEDIL